MARIRTLKPEIWMSPQVMNLPYDARLLFIGLITQADDEGRGTADFRRLKAAVFGGDDETASNVRRMLDDIHRQGLALLYETSSHGLLFQLTGWKSHQKIDRAKQSAYPPPDSGTAPRAFVESSSSIRRGSEGSEGSDRTVPARVDDSTSREPDAQAGNPDRTPGQNRALSSDGSIPQLTPDFEKFLESTYPETAHPANFVMAWHNAQGIVGSGKATEVDLRRRLSGFRAFVDAGGYSDASKVPTPQSWFRIHADAPYWAKEWEVKRPRNGVSDEAQQAWDKLLATNGAERDARVQYAINAVGGWSRIAERTTFEGPKLRIEFCRAYDSAPGVAA